MNRKRKADQLRKAILRMGATNLKERVLDRDDEGVLWPKKWRGYSVHFELNGWKCCSPDHTRYEAYKGAYECAKMASERRPDNENV